MITTQTGKLYRQRVSTSMPEKPKALSPSTAITGPPLTTAAATEKPMPMPMMPQVPTSRRLRGLYMSTMLRVKSSALAPSLTRHGSGFALTMSRTTASALWKFIGTGFFARVSAILAMFLFLRSAMAAIHCASGLGQLEPIAPSSADTQEPMSPTSGASMRTLLSASCGEISIWMNLWPPQSLCDWPPQVLPLPCESSQLRRAPTSITTSASGSTKERAAEAHCSCVSGSRPLAMDMGLLPHTHEPTSEEHTSELQARQYLVWRILLRQLQSH